MDVETFVRAFKDEIISSHKMYCGNSEPTAVSECLAKANLTPEQMEHVSDALKHLMIDVHYTFLLHLDGSANIGGLQHSYKLIDEDGNAIYESGDLEAEAWEQLQNDQW